jgi:magnesium transporter
MNFEHMPELGKTWAYPAVLAAMVAIGFGMALWFKRRGWL